MEILNKLGIDFSVILAQAVNFFVLLGILSFFVYKPILKLLDERKERIARAEKNAQLIDEKLANTEELVEAELKKARKEAHEIVASTKKIAKELEEKLTADAKKKVEKIVAEGKEAIAQERDKASAEIQKEVAKIVILATEKLLGREVNAKDQEGLIVNAIEEIGTLG